MSPILLRPLLLLSLLAALLTGCATDSAPAAGGNVFHLGISESGRAFTVKPGDTLVINLASNASTGAVWEFVDLDRSLFAEEKTTQYKTHSDAPLPGEGGKVTFTLRAKKPGMGHVKMLYRRPWQPNDPWGTFDVTITIAN